MTRELVFTPEQNALIQARQSTYVDACPGAGKTQAIVQRFIERPDSDSRRGVALISFTNAAIEEARSRCAQKSELLQVPNFVGTIDSFINRFLVGPAFLARTGVAPSFLDKWMTVPGTTVKSKSVPVEASLDWFEFDLDGHATLSTRRIPPDLRHQIRGLESWAINKLEAEASSIWTRQVERGVLDAAAARTHLARYIHDPRIRIHFIELMRSRFSEVIVDEVQDCCSEDVQVLELLLEAEVRLTLVGDPDQAIYGFRGNQVNGLADLISDITPGLRLNGNFRSSPAICKAVDSLRSDGLADTAVGVHAQITLPVSLLQFTTTSEATKKITGLLQKLNVARDDVVVLAHAASKARAVAGAAAPMKPKASKLTRLAYAIHESQNEGQPSTNRIAALRMLERSLRELGTDGLSELSTEDYLASRELTRSQFRERCLRLAMAVDAPFGSAPSAFKAQMLQQRMSQEELGWSLQRAPVPAGDKWPAKPTFKMEALPYSTIHGYKGLQAEAVVLVIPKPADTEDGDGVSLWTSGQGGESRRVLYVGASRAQKLLVIAAHDSVHDGVASTLEADAVPLDRL